MICDPYTMYYIKAYLVQPVFGNDASSTDDGLAVQNWLLPN